MLKHLTLVTLSLVSLTIIIGCGSGQKAPIAGPAGPAGPQGPAGLTFLNAYNSQTPYLQTDVVTYQGSSYIAIAGNTNVAPIGAPGSAADWAVLAQAGAAGQAGATGPQGPIGLQGVPGATGPAGPSGPTGATGQIGATGTDGKNMVSFLQNRRFAVNGDSISSLFGNAWQNVVISRTGMTLVVQDARAGRSFATAFECWGNPSVGESLGTFNANYTFPRIGGTCGGAAIGIADKSTLAESLTNVDLQAVVLGTNDQTTPLGQLGDSARSGTFYGNMRWVVETYLTAKPSLRLVLVTLQQNTYAPPAVSQQYANAMVAYGNSMGIPVVNEFALGGVNSISASALTRDGTHPSDFAFANFFGPVIAQAFQKIF